MDKCTPESLLAGRKIKLTRQRQEVLSEIIESEGPFCATDLHEELMGEMDIATIYRNLEVLLKSGIIRYVVNDRERQYYELACLHNPEHPHFLCNSCGRIFCLKKNNPPRVKNFVPEDFLIEQTSLQFRGVCPQCRELQDG